YAMLGAGWLRVKERGELRKFAARALGMANVAFVVLAVLAWLAATIVQPELRSRLMENWIAFSLLAVLLFCCAGAAIGSVAGTSDFKPFAFGECQCAIAAAGAWLVVSPDIVPFRMSLWSAASAAPSHEFLLTGAGVVVPLILAYSAFAYRVFRGKVPEQGLES